MTESLTLESFTYPVDVTELDAEGETASLTASDADKEKLTEFLAIPGVTAFSGTAEATRRGSLVRVTGSIEATLQRQCVASLEEMTEEIAETFSAEFTTDAPETTYLDEVEADLDAPEPLESDRLDLGAVLIEQLVLAMSAHPRKDDADPIVDPRADEKISPFDILKPLSGPNSGDDA